MEHGIENAAALTVALALAAGVVTQSVARHLRIPGIVLLLAAGAVLGPDLLDVVRPDTLGGSLSVLVGMAVAIILFEGGMGLELARLRRQSLPIRRLLTEGALVTAVGGAVAARFLLDWDWSLSVLFGSLVIVTGPTVIQPLLRRIKVRSSVKTVLEAEGVFIDAIGATLAVVTLSVVLDPADTIRTLLIGLAQKLGFGVLAGAAGGWLIATLLRFRRVVPEGLENVFTLSLVLALYQSSHALFPESGIAAVTVAGLVVGNLPTRALPDLKEFKEQMTVMLIGMLFVLLAADVRIEEVRALGTGGLLTVAALMLVVRPLNVLVSTRGSQLDGRERTFLAWLAPRGIVAAAVASLFADELTLAGIPGGREMRALVFLLIAITVLVQGFTGGLVASLLGLRRAEGRGFVILGANGLGLALGRALRCTGSEVVFMDSNPHASHEAEEAGFRVIFGNALQERPLQLAELDVRAGCIGVTRNEEMNLLFAETARLEYKVPRAWVALREGESRITPEKAGESGVSVLFGAPEDLETWEVRFDRGSAGLQGWVWNGKDRDLAQNVLEQLQHRLLPLALRRGEKVLPWDASWEPRRGDMLYVAVTDEVVEEAGRLLETAGFEPADAPECP
jgi:NhaP-type Na+/H+ or K+/H+ antiporter